MADIQFSCPHCNQVITADAAWGGHELQCPTCQGSLIAPASEAPPAPAAGRSAGASNPLVPKPQPGGGAARLSSAAQVPAQSRTVPVRNLAPPKPAKKSPVVKVAITAAVLVALGAGGYFGFIWVRGYQDKMNAKSREAEKNSDGGQVGHILALNETLDKTEPGRMPAGDPVPTVPRSRRKAGSAGQEIPATTDSGAAAPVPTGPVTPPVWTLDVNQAKIPDGRANGTISGTNFLADTVRIDPVGTALALRLLHGQIASPDGEMLVYLHLKAGEKLGGQKLTVAQDMSGSSVPQVAKRWKVDPRYAPKQQNYRTGYAMKLELGQATNNTVPGKIFLALPDKEQSVVAGGFTAAISQVDPNAQPAADATPASDSGAMSSRSIYESRYGIRR